MNYSNGFKVNSFRTESSWQLLKSTSSPYVVDGMDRVRTRSSFLHSTNPSAWFPIAQDAVHCHIRRGKVDCFIYQPNDIVYIMMAMLAKSVCIRVYGIGKKIEPTDQITIILRAISPSPATNTNWLCIPRFTKTQNIMCRIKTACREHPSPDSVGCWGRTNGNLFTDRPTSQEFLHYAELALFPHHSFAAVIIGQ